MAKPGYCTEELLEKELVKEIKDFNLIHYEYKTKHSNDDKLSHAQLKKEIFEKRDLKWNYIIIVCNHKKNYYANLLNYEQE